MPDVDIYILAIQEYIRYIYDADNTISTSRFQLFDLYLVGIDTLDIYLFFKENNLLFVGPPHPPHISSQVCSILSLSNQCINLYGICK